VDHEALRNEVAGSFDFDIPRADLTNVFTDNDPAHLKGTGTHDRRAADCAVMRQGGRNLRGHRCLQRGRESSNESRVGGEVDAMGAARLRRVTHDLPMTACLRRKAAEYSERVEKFRHIFRQHQVGRLEGQTTTTTRGTTVAVEQPGEEFEALRFRRVEDPHRNALVHHAGSEPIAFENLDQFDGVPPACTSISAHIGGGIGQQFGHHGHEACVGAIVDRHRKGRSNRL
jgi:hypothetical protein